MTIEIQTLRLQLIEAQMTVLQYQHRDTQTGLAQLKNLQAQSAFDAAADAHDIPSGATKQPDQYAGS